MLSSASVFKVLFTDVALGLLGTVETGEVGVAAPNLKLCMLRASELGEASVSVSDRSTSCGVAWLPAVSLEPPSTVEAGLAEALSK